MSGSADMTRTTAARYRAGSSDTRCAIVLTAERWFRRVGFRRTAIADVAAELGMSPANVYRFFRSKAAINEAVAERVFDTIAADLRRIVERGDLSPAEQLRTFLLTWAETSSAVFEGDEHIREMVEAAMRETWSVCLEHKRQIDQMIRRILETGSITGDFTVRYPVDAARCVRAAMVQFTHPGLISCRATGSAAEAMVTFVLDALTAPSSGYG